ncbi:hypothetical protein [Streptomyces sp.]|uniref:hypothetical protein n=1 Tax=Streptomyces sp. TaxID=1931 RepID=UPI002F402313
MSRETDSPSSGPQGRGGAAYPSGTQPYGARPFPSLHPQERPRPAGAPEAPEAPQPGVEPPAAEPKTETTLTTRVRINIPGSRPIPPVVVRTPVETPPGADQPTTEIPAPPDPSPEEEPEAAQEKEPSDWFAPRKPVAAPQTAPQTAPDAGPGADPFAPSGAGSGTQPRTPSAADPFAAPGAGRGTAPGTPSGAAPGPVPAPGLPGPAPVPAPGFPGPAPVPAPGPFGEQVAGHGRPGDPDDAPFAELRVDPFTDRPYTEGPFGERVYADAETGSTPTPPSPSPSLSPYPAPAADSPPGGPRGLGPQDTPAAGFPSLFAGGADGTGDFPPGVPHPADPFPAGSPDAYISGPANPQFPGPQPPVGPTTGPATGAMRLPLAAEPDVGLRPSPQFPLPGGGPSPEGGGPVSDDTLVNGIPRVPPAESRPAPAPAPQPVPASPATSAPARKKGRSKLVLLGVAAGGALFVAYGAGLLMNHAEVPKGTTVLGVDIGDKSKEDALKTLETALGNRTTAPLTLSVGGRRQSLKPSVAGLSVDTDATVRGAAHTDYNPVSVIGSLFGGPRTAEPVIVVDEDKLKVALTSVAGRNSAGSDAMVRFSEGKAIGVPGRPGKTFDVNAAANKVAAAYRARAESGVDQPVALAVTTAPPKVSQAELAKAVNGFGKAAMSGYVTIRADDVHFITFGPNRSLPKFLTMLPTPDGHLAPHIDLAVLESLYGGTFDGVLLERGNGTRTPVTPQDIATAMIPGLSSTVTADRTVTLPNVAQ